MSITGGKKAGRAAKGRGIMGRDKVVKSIGISLNAEGAAIMPCLLVGFSILY